MPFPYGSGRAIVRHCLHNDDIALAMGFDKAVTKADKVVKRSLDATTDEIASALQEAVKI